MKKTALLFLFFAAASYPALAKPDHHQQHHQYAAGAKHAHQWRHAHQGDHARTAYRAHSADRRVYRASQPSANVGSHSNITCDMVRSYVAQVGLAQARAMAAAAGMTAAEERRARQCLTHGA
jgi:hypothetical protein